MLQFDKIDPCLKVNDLRHGVLFTGYGSESCAFIVYNDTRQIQEVHLSVLFLPDVLMFLSSFFLIIKDIVSFLYTIVEVYTNCEDKVAHYSKSSCNVPFFCTFIQLWYFHLDKCIIMIYNIITNFY